MMKEERTLRLNKCERCGKRMTNSAVKEEVLSREKSELSRELGRVELAAKKS